jgi:hypothetical protein
MTYIFQERRDYIECHTVKEIIQDTHKFSVEELNYLISKILWSYFDSRRGYGVLNDILGILEAVKLEFYQRKAEPYLFWKRAENGDL